MTLPHSRRYISDDEPVRITGHASPTPSLDNTFDSAQHVRAQASHHDEFYARQRTPSLPSRSSAGQLRKPRHVQSREDGTLSGTSLDAQQSEGSRVPDSSALPGMRRILEQSTPPPTKDRNDKPSWQDEDTMSNSGEDEQGVNETEAPAPVQSGDRSGLWRRNATLEARENESSKRKLDEDTVSNSGEDEQGVNETEAPEPIQTKDRSGSWRRDETLESKESDSNTRKLKEHYKSPKSSFATQLYIVSYLIFFSIWGTLARLGMQWLTFYPGAPVVISNLWANFAGTLVMGFFSEDQNLFRDEWGYGAKSHDGRARDKLEDEEKAARKAAHGKVKKTIPLYVGLTVGFCGSFTSFSTFMRDVFFALANEVATPINHPNDSSSPSATVSRNRGYSFTALVAIVLLTLGMSVSALKCGAHLALALRNCTPTLPFRIVRRGLDPLMVFLGFGCWLGAIIITIVPPDRRGGPIARPSGVAGHWRSQALFACCFAPVGCLLRYQASVMLNSRVPWFPLGTFAANIFGTAMLAMSYDLQHTRIGGTVGGTLVGCQALQGIEDGFCGALTTISTWIVELQSLQRRHAYFYGGSSVVVAFCLMVVIMGSVSWTVGFSSAICVTETS